MSPIRIPLFGTLITTSGKGPAFGYVVLSRIVASRISVKGRT